MSWNRYAWIGGLVLLASLSLVGCASDGPAPDGATSERPTEFGRYQPGVGGVVWLEDIEGKWPYYGPGTSEK